MQNTIETEELFSPAALMEELPANAKQLSFIKNNRNAVVSILNGEDSRLLLIVGPCSLHDPDSAMEYARKLRQLSDQYSDTFLILMRAYFEKPRTSTGWKGMLYDPHLNGSNDIASGLRHTRKLLLNLADMQIGAATEFLDPVTPCFLGDLISWACIGARTAESQIHRQLASGLPMPVAFKNSTSGNIDIAIRGILAAAGPHAFFGINNRGKISIVRTQGNPYAHISLRGGEGKPNYDSASITSTLGQLHAAGLPPRLIVDCSHGNSYRNYEDQKEVFQSVLHQRQQGNDAIRGLILESHLFAGKQQLTSDKKHLKYAVSITDPCIDWKTTERLITWAANQLQPLKQIPAHDHSACNV